MLRFAINRPVTIMMLFLSLIIFGFMSLKKMPTNLFPDVQIPLIKITTYANGDLNYIESKITKKIEDEIVTIDNIDKIRSISYDNLSVVIVQFKLEKDIEVAANDIRDHLSKLDLAVKPQIEKLSADSSKILSLFITSKKDNQKELMYGINDKIKPFLQRVEGVGKVDSIGYSEPKIKIYLDPFLLDKYHLDAAKVAAIIKSQNLKFPIGKLSSEDKELFIRGEFDATSLQEIENLTLLPGLFLKDVATIKQGYDDINSLVIMDGKEGVLLDILKVSGENSLKTIKNIKKSLNTLIELNPNLNIKVAYDKSDTIEKHISQVGFDMTFGVFLTIFIVFFFLRDGVATLIAAIAIPTSIISTFFIIDILGYDLNRLTLIALTLGIGIFIDDAIVVTENIAKKMQSNKEPLFAAFDGVKEIVFSLLSISTVLLCVFIPIAFMGGIVGRYFNSFALSVAGGVIVSFFVSILLIPTLGGRFTNSKQSNFYKKTEPFFRAGEELYAKTLHFILKFKAIFLTAVAILIALIMSLTVFVGTDFLPMEDNSEFEVYLETKPTTSLNETKKAALPILEEIVSDKDVEDAYLLVGYTDAKESHKAKIYVKLKSLKERTIRQPKKIEQYRAKLNHPELKIRILELPIVEAAGVTEPVQISIIGESFEKLDELSAKAREILENIDGVVDIKSSNEDSKENLKITLEREKMARMGLNAYEVAQVLYHSFSLNAVGNVDIDGKQYEMVMRFDDKDKKSIEDLMKFKLINSNNESFYLGSIAKFSYQKSRANINRLNREREVLITANINKTSLDVVQKAIDSELKPLLPSGYDCVYLGFIEMMDDTNEIFIFTIALSAALIYLILASLYESFILPFIIMISMPLAFAGVVAGLTLSGNSFSLFVMIGAILLFGMVGKNAILVVDFANRFVHEGKSPDEAVVLAGRKRLRAVLMTTFAMIFAMLPLAISKGSGYEGNSPMAISIIAGLISSTFLTLLVVPALFGVVYRVDKWFRKFYEKDKI